MLRNGSVVPIHTPMEAGSWRPRIRMASEARRACARARTNLPVSIRNVVTGSSNCFNISTSIMSGMARERPVVPVSSSIASAEVAARPAYKSGIAAVAAGWLLCCALTVLIYLPWLSAPYYSDDFLFYFAPPPPHLYDFFRMPGASAQLYRPAESIILRIIQSRFGFHTVAIHLVAIAAHASLCSMVWLAATRLKFTPFCGRHCGRLYAADAGSAAGPARKRLHVTSDGSRALRAERAASRASLTRIGHTSIAQAIFGVPQICWILPAQSAFFAAPVVQGNGTRSGAAHRAVEFPARISESRVALRRQNHGGANAPLRRADRPVSTLASRARGGLSPAEALITSDWDSTCLAICCRRRLRS